ncbi:MAG TPA: hypothetical protein VHR55_08695 [Candidatus Limnocylindria bacterium]|nr:hypothetical protein [Candidatus Limnocylindria bacterium]
MGAATEEVVLSSDALEAVLLPGLGCRLHRLRAFGQDLLRTPATPADHAADPFNRGGYVLAPWTNRASARPMTVAGRTVHLRPNFPDGTAIHGQVSLRPWKRVGDAAWAVEGGGEGWPWPYRVTLDAAVDGARLDLRYRLENRSDAPMPAGLGIHPWFAGPESVALSAARVVPRNDERGVAPVAASGEWSLAAGRRPWLGLDATWLDVDPPRATLRWSSGIRLELEALRRPSGPLQFAVASPHTPDAVAVEPVTHAPWALDALADGDATAMPLLDPGDVLELDVSLSAHR